MSTAISVHTEMQCNGRQPENMCYLILIILSKNEACDCYCHLIPIDLSKKSYCYLIASKKFTLVWLVLRPGRYVLGDFLLVRKQWDIGSLFHNTFLEAFPRFPLRPEALRYSPSASRFVLGHAVEAKVAEQHPRFCPCPEAP